MLWRIEMRRSSSEKGRPEKSHPEKSHLEKGNGSDRRNPTVSLESLAAEKLAKFTERVDLSAVDEIERNINRFFDGHKLPEILYALSVIAAVGIKHLRNDELYQEVFRLMVAQQVRTFPDSKLYNLGEYQKETSK
jgi:hypothetical protein